MRERTETGLKLVCAVLVALVLTQVVKAGLRASSLRGVVIPNLPTLASDTNAAPVEATNLVASAGKGTNKVVAGTNVISGKDEKTNAAANVVNKGVTNDLRPLSPSAEATAHGVPANDGASDLAMAARSGNEGTNSPSTVTKLVATNAVAQTESGSNAVNITMSATNSVPGTNAVSLPVMALAETNPASMSPTSHLTVLVSGTNVSGASTNVGTNLASSASAKKKGTNSPAPQQMVMNAGPPGMRGGGGPPPELAPEIKARVSRIYESELFGPVMRPQPMALMGIAGNTAFLRSPSGQTGLVKEGDTLGEIKLLRIGINRVLVEQGGQKKELTIFEGYGSKSLLEDSK